jgi:hypothetical protein
MRKADWISRPPRNGSSHLHAVTAAFHHRSPRVVPFHISFEQPACLPYAGNSYQWEGTVHVRLYLRVKERLE